MPTLPDSGGHACQGQGEIKVFFGSAQVARVEQMESAAEAKAARGPKATIRRELTRVHTPATPTGATAGFVLILIARVTASSCVCTRCNPLQLPTFK